MTWLDVIVTAQFLILCVVVHRLYRVTQAIDDMYSGLGQLIGQHLEISKTVLHYLDGRAAVPGPPDPRYSLLATIRTIAGDLSIFKNRWEQLHGPDFDEMLSEKVKRRLEEHERIMEEHRRRKEQEREAKTKDAPETGDT